MILEEHYNEMADNIIRNNKNMRYLIRQEKRENTKLSLLKMLMDTKQEIEIKSHKKPEHFYNSKIGKPPEQIYKRIINVGSEDIEDISDEEVRYALKCMKKKLPAKTKF